MFFIIEQTTLLMQSRYLNIRLKALRRLKFSHTHDVWGSSLCWNEWVMLIKFAFAHQRIHSEMRWIYSRSDKPWGFFLLGVGVCVGVQHLKEMSTRVKDSNSIKMLKEYFIMIHSDKMRKWEKIYSPQSPIK